MNYIAIFLIPFCVGFISPLIFGLIRKSNLKKEKRMNSNEYIITSPLALAWAGLFFAIVFSIFSIVMNIQKQFTPIQNLLVIPFLFACFLGCFVLIREIKVINNDSIKFVPAFGRTKYYSFKDIKKVEVAISSSITSYKIIDSNGKKMFFVNDLNVGGKLFLNKLKDMNIPFEEKRI